MTNFWSRWKASVPRRNVPPDELVIGRLRSDLEGLFEVANRMTPPRALQGTVVFIGKLLHHDPDYVQSELAERWARHGYTPYLRLNRPQSHKRNQEYPGHSPDSWQTDALTASEQPHQIIAHPAVVQVRRSDPRINLVLFLATLVSIVVTGTLSSSEAGEPAPLTQGIWLALALMAILGAHEFGHYWAARRHGVAVTLPYFIPLPLVFIGTLGAFIRMQAPVRNRRHLFDIGVAGPLAGLAVAVPLLLLGLAQSEVKTLPSDGVYLLEGNSLFYQAAKYVIHGELLPANGRDVMLHPVAFAAWFGLLVTAFNLLPIGQLDGGHVVFALIGDKAQRVSIVLVVLLALAGMLLWPGWLTWALLVTFMALRHPPPLNDITPLDSRRRVLAALVLLIFVLVFVPVPLTITGSESVFW